MTPDELHLIASAIAWADGVQNESIATVAREVDYLASAQQCAEDLGIA
jgi:hypothetical protein